MSESERFSGRRTGKSPAERSNFAQACTLLGQFLKEKRNLGVGVFANTEAKEKLETFLPSMTTKNFLTNMENQSGVSAQNAVVAPTVKPSGFVQNLVGFSAEDSIKADPRKSTDTRNNVNKAESSQMTIFYSGKVLVFNDLPADKANEVIALARSGNSSNVNGSVSVSVSEPTVIEIIDLSKSVSPEPANVVGNNKAGININININESDKSFNYNDSNDMNDDNNNNYMKKSGDRTMPQRPSEPANGSDLPIARRNSLHRFLAKRKDRVASKAPYQVPNRGAGAAMGMTMAPPRPEEGSSKEGECSERQLDLKL